MANRGDFGVGVNSAFHTYVYTLLQATEELLVDPRDRGSMARTHEKIGASDTVSMQPRTLAQLPTLTARTQLAQLGITGGWSQEGPRGRKRRKMETAWADRVEAGNRSPADVVVHGKLIADPAYMTPMWEAGLFEYEDFVTAIGDRRVLTFDTPYPASAINYKYINIELMCKGSLGAAHNTAPAPPGKFTPSPDVTPEALSRPSLAHPVLPRAAPLILIPP
eukprot:4787299-Pyramimonas_sp.AAC.2